MSQYNGHRRMMDMSLCLRGHPSNHYPPQPPSIKNTITCTGSCARKSLIQALHSSNKSWCAMGNASSIKCALLRASTYCKVVLGIMLLTSFVIFVEMLHPECGNLSRLSPHKHNSFMKPPITPQAQGDDPYVGWITPHRVYLIAILWFTWFSLRNQHFVTWMGTLSHIS